MDIARLYTPASLRIRIRLDERIDKGRVAQLGEHRPYKPGVTGSIPVPPTIDLPSIYHRFTFWFFNKVFVLRPKQFEYSGFARVPLKGIHYIVSILS